MEWDNDRVLDFIKEYKKREILWKKDYVHINHHNMIKKEDAWKEIAEIMETDVEILKKKMESLRGSRRREKSRISKSIDAKKGRKKIYISSWFAWESMKFLDEPEKTEETFNICQGSENVEENENNSPPLMLNCAGDSDTTDPKERKNLLEGQGSSTSDELAHGTKDVRPNTKGQASKKRFKSPKKLPPKRHEDMRAKAHQINLNSRAASAADEENDECSTFANYICEKMRKLDSTRRAILMYEIHGLVLQAELGAQTLPKTQSPLPLSNYHSLSSSSHRTSTSLLPYSLTSPPRSSTLSPHTHYSWGSSPLPSPDNASNKFLQNSSPQTYSHDSTPPDSSPNPSSEPTL